jgi:hypothetical protein
MRVFSSHFLTDASAFSQPAAVVTPTTAPANSDHEIVCDEEEIERAIAASRGVRA